MYPLPGHSKYSSAGGSIKDCVPKISQSLISETYFTSLDNLYTHFPPQQISLHCLTLYCPMTPYGVMTFVNSP